MKKILLSIVLISYAATLWALDIECTPGNLANLVRGKTFTTLALSGEMDARDFKFINDSLDVVTSFDLSQVNIVDYHTTKPLFASDLDYPSNGIPTMAFFGKKVTQITLPSSAKSVGMAAFAGCENLTQVVFNDGLDSIASHAFTATKLSSISLPSSLRVMGEGVFSNITSLTSATLNPTSNFTIPKSTFRGCTHLSEITIGANVTEIGECAFKGTSRLNAINFSGANNLSVIGKEAFVGSGVTNFNFGTFNNLNHIDDWAFAQSKQVSVTIPSSTQRVGKGAFYYAGDLLTYISNERTDTISDMLLAGTGVTNENALGTVAKHIGDFALYNTPATKMTIPSTVEYIGEKAMAGMTQLQKLTTNATIVPELGENVWAGVNQANIPLIVPSQSFNDYRNALQWQNFMITNPSVFGDVNQDGYVTSADITAIYDILLGYSTNFIETADVNGDGYVTSADITAVYNVLLGIQNAPGRNQIVNDNNDKMSAEDFIIEAGNTHTMSIDFDNATSYAAMQLDLNMPQGLSIDNVTMSDRANGMTMGFNEIENGKWRILFFCSPDKAMKTSKGLLMDIKVKADETFTGNEVITISNIIAVEPSERSHMIKEFTVGVSTVTGVKDINTDITTGNVDVYSINGQLLRHNVERENATSGLPAGVYIVGGKKVIVR